jgi:ABC-type antimicrobial peptide transport system permease subunit
MRTFLALLGFALAVNIVFAMMTFVFFRGQIKNAETAADYLHYAIGALTTSDTGDMIPMTDAVQLWTSFYVLTVWVYIVWVAVNHVSNIKFGRLG